MAQQLAEQIKYRLLVDHVNVVQGEYEGLTDLFQVIQNMARDHACWGQDRCFQQIPGLQLTAGERTRKSSQQVTDKSPQVVVALVE